jgi:hypothetical protein
VSRFTHPRDLCCGGVGRDGLRQKVATYRSGEFLGLFIGPTLIAVMFTLMQAWRAAISGHLSSEEVMKTAA